MDCWHSYWPGLIIVRAVSGESAMSLVPASFIANKWRSTMARIDTGTLTFVAPGWRSDQGGGRQAGPGGALSD